MIGNREAVAYRRSSFPRQVNARQTQTRVGYCGRFRLRSRSAPLVALSLLLLGSSSLSGQDSREGFKFTFGPPGARSLGLGGAFVAVADDATAAVSNPAGLVILQEREVSAEFRFFSQDVSVFAVDRTLTEQSTQARPSFFSAVFPRGSVALAVFYHETASYELTTGFTEEPYSWGNWQVAVPGTSLRYQRGEAWRVQNIGAALGIRIGSRIALGVGGLLVRARRSYFQDTDYSVAQARPGSVIEFENRRERREVNSAGDSPGVRAGVLVNPGGRVSVGIGAVWYGGPQSLSTHSQCQRFSTGAPAPCTLKEGETQDWGSDSAASGSLGLAVRPTSHWVVAADVLVSEVGWSHPMSFRGGVEYTFLAGRTPVSLRAGAYGDQPSDNVEHELFATAGLGVVLGANVQMDVAFATSRETKQAIASLVARF
jgi:long-subunit fatty acid transport protein